MRIDLFRSGSHTAMGGQTIEFTEADLAASAAAYDPAVHEAPIVIGHPKEDAPAYGWVQSLETASGEMTAVGHQINPAFAEIVEAGSYKKKSASFYPPNHPANPKPGVYYLRHVGFLGAQPPAIKGLRDVQFGEDDADFVTVELDFSEGSEFAENRAGQVARTMAEAWGRLRDWMIGKYGLEEADKAMPAWHEDWLRTVAAEIQADNAAEGGPRFSEAFASFVEHLVTVGVPTETPPLTGPAPDPAAEAAFAERDRKLKEREAEFAEREAKARNTADAAVLDGLVHDGKLAPGWRASIASFLERQDDVAVVSFSEGEEAETPRAFMLRLLAAGGVVVDFSERSAGKRREPRPGDLTGRLATRARALVDEAHAAGNTLSFAEAVGRAEREEDQQ